MLCKKPFARAANVTRKETRLSLEARDRAMAFPCGQCLPCRINKAREWTHRMMLEQRVSDESSFVTLTYSDEHLPEPADLIKSHLQNYLKRLRKAAYEKLRYFAVGEYGDRTGRPHYHIALFGLGLESENIIKQCWNYCDRDVGIFVGDLNKDSARYITGYCIKKLTRDGEKGLNGRAPEFAIMSRNGEGGIGVGAVKEMARKIRDKPYYKKEDRRIIRELKYGKNNRMPLGRYLTKKLIDELGIDDYKLQSEIYDWQEQCFDKHCDKELSYYQSLVEEEEGKRLKLEKKQKLFRQRRRF